MSQRKKTIKAFTLLELSIVVLVSSILISGAFGVSIISINNAKIKITKERQKEVYEAMGRYLAANGRIPCPASMLLSKTDSNYGVEVSCSSLPASSSGVWQSSGSDNVYYGMIPSKTLGLKSEMAEDAFGSKFAYVMIKGYGIAADFGTAANTTVDISTIANRTNKISVYENFINNTTEAIEVTHSEASVPKAIFVIISYGANKSGAFNSNSTSQNAAPNPNSDEGYNALNNTYYGTSFSSQSGNFYNRGTESSFFNSSFLASSPNGAAFDDILFYKTLEQMAVDFNLLNLIKCVESASSQASLYPNLTFKWPDAGFGEIVNANYSSDSNGGLCPTGYRGGSKYPTRRCDAFGSWGDIIMPCVLK